MKIINWLKSKYIKTWELRKFIFVYMFCKIGIHSDRKPRFGEYRFSKICRYCKKGIVDNER